MRIGVAIPCYEGHKKNLIELFHSIEKQSVLPDKVVVSCSSSDEFELEGGPYSFPIRLITHKEKKSAAENRNIATNILLEDGDIDYITYIDADDIMAPQRIEVIKKVIEETHSEMIVHNFYFENEMVNMDMDNFQPISSIEYKVNIFTPCPTGCLAFIPGEYESHYHIHNSQVTIKKEIFHHVHFPEGGEYHRREDAVFCNRVIRLGVKNAYIINKLSFYKPSGTIF
jgi:glycosyltransferase involved in cell wall biosynthesis